MSLKMRGCKGLYVLLSMPKSLPLTEFVEASEEQAYELCSPGRCDKHGEETWKGRGAAEREEQKEEAQDKMLGKKAASGG